MLKLLGEAWRLFVREGLASARLVNQSRTADSSSSCSFKELALNVSLVQADGGGCACVPLTLFMIWFQWTLKKIKM